MGKAENKSNKTKVKEFVKTQIDQKIIDSKSISVKTFDISDAIMIGLAFKTYHDLKFSVKNQ